MEIYTFILAMGNLTDRITQYSFQFLTNILETVRFCWISSKMELCRCKIFYKRVTILSLKIKIFFETKLSYYIFQWKCFNFGEKTINFEKSFKTLSCFRFLIP